MDAGAADDPGIVDEDVQRAVLAANRAHDALPIRGRGHVEAYVLRLATSFADRRGRRLACGVGHVREHDPRALLASIRACTLP